MEITKYKHTTYKIEADNKKILIDPGIFTFGENLLSRDYFRDIDVLLLSHKHADHFDIEAIKETCKNSSPKVYSQKDVAQELDKIGIKSRVLNPGESVKLENLLISATRTAHKQECIGFILNDGKKSLYYVSDSFYLEDKPKADAIIVPICDRRIMMNVKEAMDFVKEGGYKLAIPSHYETPKDEIKPEEFEKEMI